MHLCHHYVFLFGDMNFRCGSSPKNVLDLVSKACALERDALWGGDTDWRRKAYRKILERQPHQAKVLPRNVRDAWAKVLALDELQLVVNESEIFHRFLEPNGLPTFPPSFRRKMGDAGACGDYSDSDQLLGAYTTNVKEKVASKAGKAPKQDNIEDIGGSGDDKRRSNPVIQESINKVLKLGERIPSYTDRVLYHCLPDKENDIIPGPYELCDTLFGSDHRPVSSTFQILVDSSINMGKAPATSEGSMYGSGSEDSRGTRCMLSFKASDLKLAISDNASDAVLGNLAEQAEEVVVVFPMPTEDPLVETRRVHALASAIGGIGGTSDSPTIYHIRNSTETVAVQSRDLMENQKRVAWQTCTTSEGIQMISECRPELGTHALIKLNNKNGECLGQSVVGLAGMFDVSGSARGAEGAEAGGTRTEQVKLDLTQGGQLLGQLQAKIHLAELILNDTTSEDANMV